LFLTSEATLQEQRLIEQIEELLPLLPGHHDMPIPSSATLRDNEKLLRMVITTLHPTPYTLHPTPYTLHPTPYTLSLSHSVHETRTQLPLLPGHNAMAIPSSSTLL